MLPEREREKERKRERERERTRSHHRQAPNFQFSCSVFSWIPQILPSIISNILISTWANKK